jgi:hypothetical protein
MQAASELTVPASAAGSAILLLLRSRWQLLVLTAMMTVMTPAAAKAGRPHGAPVLDAWRDQMTEALEQIRGLLHEASETHHRVFRIVDGADDDWASWYAQWLIDLSELPDLLGVRPVRSELIFLLVSLDKQFAAEAPGEPWETYYARQILRHFQPAGD